MKGEKEKAPLTIPDGKRKSKFLFLREGGRMQEMKGFFKRHISAGKPKKKKIQFFLWGTLLLFLIFIFPLISLLTTPFRAFFPDIPEMISSRHLVLLQNEAELRPTGGFLSAIALIEVKSGIPHITLLDSYSISPALQEQRAPRSITNAFKDDPSFRGWVFRDTNYHPDFSESVPDVLRFLAFDPRFKDMKFDSVSAVNMRAVESLLYDQGLLPNDFFYQLQREGKDIDLHSEKALSERKNGLQTLSNALIEAMSYFSLPRISKNIAASFEKKDIQIFFFDPDLQQKARDLGWTGEFPQKDFFAVNIANLGAKKSNHYLKTSFEQVFSLDENFDQFEHFQIHFDQLGTKNILSGEGQYFLRVFRPKGMIFSDANNNGGWAQKTHEHYEEFSQMILLKPKEERTLSLQLKFPQKWKSGTREITWVKQSGVDVSLDIAFRAAGDMRFSLEGCDRAVTRENVSFCSLYLDRDRSFMASLQKDIYAPFFENVRFQNDREIFVRFSENISNISDVILSCNGDSFAIKKVVLGKQERRDATLVLEKSVPLQGQFCTLSLMVTDVFKNEDKKEITVPAREK